eukprot:TRINITY_DN6254_c0_g1_i2.p1 TRINITY_DN6254_c0_g1~~TRINITY_DN6254_c0_g1_i2.p1  ORF type:complete len:314 (-),score=117.53 TRINITY_DN6254_c0_g1_i2:884-1729(-)
MEIESSLITTPFAVLRQSYEVIHQQLEFELNSMVDEISEIESKPFINPIEANLKIGQIVAKLQGLKRKLEQNSTKDEEQFRILKARVEYAKQATTNPEKFQQTRLDCAVVDHLARNTYFDCAYEIANRTNIKNLVEINLYFEEYKIIQALNNNSCTECLLFCETNKNKLKEINSRLELDLRLQEFIELVKLNDKNSAINYARRNFSHFTENKELDEIKKAMGLLVYSNKPLPKRYEHFFSQERWKNLINLFSQTFKQVHYLMQESSLNLFLGLGLSALKTE